MLLDEVCFCDEELMLEEEIFCEDELAFDERFFSVAEDEDFLEDELLLALDEELADFSVLLEVVFSASLSGFATDEPLSLHAMNIITISEINSLLKPKLILYSFIRTGIVNNIKN